MHAFAQVLLLTMLICHLILYVFDAAPTVQPNDNRSLKVAH